MKTKQYTILPKLGGCIGTIWKTESVKSLTTEIKLSFRFSTGGEGIILTVSLTATNWSLQMKAFEPTRNVPTQVWSVIEVMVRLGRKDQCASC